MNDCLIYCRVASVRQGEEGSDLAAQERRCRAYAEGKGYRVLAVFGDEGVSGASLERTGMQRLLAFLKRRREGGEVAVVTDNPVRIARGVGTYIKLRAALDARGGRLESPSFRSEENVKDAMVEAILVTLDQ